MNPNWNLFRDKIIFLSVKIEVRDEKLKLEKSSEKAVGYKSCHAKFFFFSCYFFCNEWWRYLVTTKTLSTLKPDASKQLREWCWSRDISMSWPWKTWWKQREIMFEMEEKRDVTYSKHASFISRKWKDNQFSWTWANEFFVMAFLMSFWIVKTFRKSTLKRRITCELWDVTNSNIHQC